MNISLESVCYYLGTDPTDITEAALVTGLINQAKAKLSIQTGQDLDKLPATYKELAEETINAMVFLAYYGNRDDIKTSHLSRFISSNVFLLTYAPKE